MLWLAGYAPDVFDVVADAVEPFAGDGSEDPAPFCAVPGPRRREEHYAAELLIVLV